MQTDASRIYHSTDPGSCSPLHHDDNVSLLVSSSVFAAARQQRRHFPLLSRHRHREKEGHGVAVLHATFLLFLFIHRQKLISRFSFHVPSCSRFLSIFPEETGMHMLIERERHEHRLAGIRTQDGFCTRFFRGSKKGTKGEEKHTPHAVVIFFFFVLLTRGFFR